MSRTRITRLLAWNGPLTTGLGLALALVGGLLLTRLSPVTAAVLMGLTALAVLTLIEPLVGLLGGLFLGLLRAYLQAEVPQIPAQIGHLYVALAVGAWLARGLARRELRIPASGEAVPVLLGLLGFVGAAWLSLWNPADLVGYGLPELVKWVEVLLILLLMSERGKTRMARMETNATNRAEFPFIRGIRAIRGIRDSTDLLLWLVAGVLLVGLFQAGVGLYQFRLRGEGPEHFLIPGTDFYRAYGTFEQPNPYAGYIGITLALAVGVAVGMWGHGDAETRGWSDSPRPPVPPSPRLSIPLLLLVLLSTLGLGAALVASWSRGAWIGFGAALAAMAAALPRRSRWGVVLVGLLAVLALALYVAGLLPSAVVARLTDFAAGLRLEDVRGVGINDANYAVIERLAHWQAALEMWRTHFWTGVGLGCYEPAYRTFALINWPNALGHAHNIYLNLLAETGLIGLLAYLAFWTIVFWQSWRATRRLSGLPRGVAIGLLGAWTHLAVHNFFDNLYVNNAHLLIGLLLGILPVTQSPSHPVTQLPNAQCPMTNDQ